MRSHFQFLLCVAGLCGVAQAQTPTITGLNPPSIALSSAASGFTLMVFGTGFQGTCYVTWSDGAHNGSILFTKFIGTTELDATVPAGFVTVVETASVGVSCGQNTAPQNFSLTITGQGGGGGTLTITTGATLPQGTTGTSYGVSLAASGGTQPYQWSVVSGTTLPPGLTLNTGGVLSGTPTTANQYSFTIQVIDSSSPALMAQQTFSLTVGSPGGGGGALTIATTSLPGATVGQNYSTTLMASGGTPSYTWSSSNLPSWLTLFTTTGVLTGTPPSAGTFTFIVQVADSVSPTPHTSSRSLSLVASAGSSSSITITTGATLPQGTTGAFYSLSLAASGGNQPYLWSAITALPPGLTLSNTSGLLSGTPTTAAQYAFMVQVSDSSSPALTAQLTFSLTISAPGGTLTISTTSLPAAMAGQPYTATLTAYGGFPPYTWLGTSGVPSWLTVASNGVLSGTPPAMSTYTVTVQVSDSVSPTPHTSSKSFSLSVTSSTSLSITTPSPLPAGVVGVAYPSTTLAVSGGVGPYTWALFAGNMPPGLNLDQNLGTITGTPQTAGTYAFTVQVADSTGLDGTADFSLTVSATAAAPLTITTNSLPGAAAGQPYTATLAASGGTPPYMWTATSPPSWLTLNSSTGALSGTPPAGGSFTIAVQVTDSSAPTARTASGSFTLVVTSGSISITTASPLPAGMVGAAYPSTTLAATGGTAPYMWVILSGPSGTAANTDGLSLDPTGIISGTPLAAGTFNFTVQVTDNTGKTASKAFALTISGPSLTITTVDPSSGTVGVAFSQRYTVAGGTAPYTWQVTSGTLPPGLTFNTNVNPVTLSGTPTQQGTFTITLKVTDANQAVGTRTFTITVAPGPLRITTSGQLPAGTLGTAYTFQMAAVGGTPPYTWSATGLPAGLTISSSGLITGTVTTAGTLNFVVKVTDSAQPPVTVPNNFQINVTPPALPSITISGLPATAAPLMQYTVTIAVASAYAVDITGTAVLSSSPSDSGPTDGSIQFSGGSKSASFKVAAGTTSTTLAIQTGSVAGTITLTLSQLSAGGTDVTPTPAPSAKTQMAGGAPVITAATFSTNAGTNTLTVQITGYATSREVTQAVFTFTAATGQTLQTGASSITVPLSSLFANYFPQSASTGSQFVYSQPFTIQGGTNAINSVIPQNVTLTNRVGSSSMAAIH